MKIDASMYDVPCPKLNPTLGIYPIRKFNCERWAFGANNFTCSGFVSHLFVHGTIENVRFDAEYQTEFEFIALCVRL